MEVGHGRAGDDPLGRVAVIKRPGAAGLRVGLVMMASCVLAGCAVVSDLTALAAGGAAGSATANPAVGYAVGLGVRAGVDALQRYVVRSRQRGEQDAIAAVAGAAPLNESRPWEIRHTIPIGNDRGTLTPVREIGTKLAACREILFSVDDGGWFTTPVCRRADGWAWAAAEPAVERWGYFQSIRH